ncbi:MAG: signal recognition particle-docking protein FtsY [Ruminococcaceae bacterium]|nr:signal recognition particle-docking protein FtsY [Oscillospiraceae bacterium]MBQ4048857.1 signal recognition particle-docking protein FtsY [Clostridia bacterium]
MGFFEKIKQGLRKTRESIGAMLSSIFSGRRVDEDLMDELEEVLILADLGIECTDKVMTELRQRIKEKKIEASEDVREELREILRGILVGSGGALKLDTTPSIIMVIGVNGVGKTTTIGKIAGQLIRSGKSVIMAAGDTFRAAAAEQLTIWAERSGAAIVARGEGADPASVIFDAIQSGKARGHDVIICDTAGRLHNKSNLMNELAKIDRIINRELPGADKEVLLVIDATTGQNGLIQANEFKNVAGVTGLVLTKLDGTAKGGIALAIADSCGLPIRYVGVGEQMDDLMPFDADQYVDALL